MDEDVLRGQVTIFEVIKDFEKPKNKKRVNTKNGIPVAIKTDEWLRQRGRRNEDPKN